MNRRHFITRTSLAMAGLAVTGELAAFKSAGLKDLSPLLVDDKGRKIKTLEAWKKQREIIKTRWSEYLGFLGSNPDKPSLTVLNEERIEGVIRQFVEYEGEPGIFNRGYLLRPEKVSGKTPGIVAMHSTSDNQMLYIAGVEKGHVVPFGFRLAQQGYIVFCPQCYLWFEKDDLSYTEVTERFMKRHPGSRGMAKMLFDARRAVDVLVSLDEVDPERIGTTGHSLGAKEVLYLGAFDDRVKVIVSNEGGIGVNFSNWDDIWYLDKDIHNFGHDQDEVLALVAPRPFLLIGGDFADGEKSIPYIEAVRPIYSLYGKDPERLGFYNHGTGHSVTPEAEQRHYDWIRKYI
jgi:hypothetical protein